MIHNVEPNLTRRFLLTVSAGLFIPRWVWAEGGDKPILQWKLDETGDRAPESVSGKSDAIQSRTGHAIWVGTGHNRAIRLDGYSVWFNHIANQMPLRSGSMTISLWLALESYPVEEAAIIQLGSSTEVDARLSIDKWGYAEFAVQQGNERTVCKVAKPVPRAKWFHLAAFYGVSGATVYVDGSPAGRASSFTHPLQFAHAGDVTVGRSPDCPVVARTFPTGVLNGLLREVSVFDGELSLRSIAKMIQQSMPDGEPNLQINGPWCADDPQRTVYHALPPRAWTNEPHGLIYWRGQYHIFYQKNPNGPYWGHINWGHMTSPDLYRWTEMPVALWPEPGPDSAGCWSGSVIDHNGQLALIYPGGDGHRSSICLALSDDGIHFTKFHGNPIIPAPPQGMKFPEFRDPHVWREEDTYYMIVGSAVEGVGGTALLYRSKDLIHWEYRQPLLVGDRETSGVFWEMPVLVKVGNEYVLIVCEVPGRATYWIGSWKNETFTPYLSAPRRLELFNHFLSPTPMVNELGQVITMGIIPDERSPKESYAAGWAHLYSLPRVLSTDARGRLLQKPFEGIDRWKQQITFVRALPLQDGAIHPLEDVADVCLHVQATFRRGGSQSVSLLVRRSPDGQEQTEIRYEWEIGRLTFDRSRSSLDPQVKRDVQHATYFPPTEGSIEMEVFLDHSVLEVFVDDGAAFAARIYPTLSDAVGLALVCKGSGARAERITVDRISRLS